MLAKGSVAPSFLLTATDRSAVTLEDQKGKNVVLLFFPLAFTSTCTTELCSVRDNLSFYTSVNATVFGISVDSNATLKVFKAQQELNFELLSDFNKEASVAYGAFYDDFFGMKGVSKRAAFVIDREGIIQYAEVLENAGEVPDFLAIRQTLEQLQ